MFYRRGLLWFLNWGVNWDPYKQKKRVKKSNTGSSGWMTQFGQLSLKMVLSSFSISWRGYRRSGETAFKGLPVPQIC